MRIIDAHHHFWDPAKNYHPWLRDQPPIPFRYGDYAAIRRRFMAEEYDQAAQGWDVAATVTMEGEWDPKDPTGEALWIADLARRTGRPQAHVAQAWLDRPDLAAALEVYQDLPIVRSVRHKPRANPGPGGAPGGMADQGFIDGFLALGRQGLHFDLQTPWWHLDEATSLAERSPDTLIVLNHTGLPADRSPDGLAGWRAALTRFAEHTHSVVKISGLGLAGRPWRLEDNRAIIRDTIEIFGPDRAMFASNFPVDGLCASFDTIWQGFDRATADLSAAERRSLFAGTAARVYGLDAVNIGGPERNP
ncbi:MAG: amidohydrolase family protein [Pseudomonadota bacterium]